MDKSYEVMDNFSVQELLIKAFSVVCNPLTLRDFKIT